MVVWRMEYNVGANALEFAQEEAETRRIITTCNEDIQRYKSGLSRIYSGPVTWRSLSLSFRQIEGTLAKIRTLAALKVPVKIFYHYHVTDADYLWCYVVPSKTEKYFAGYLLAENIQLDFIETVAADMGLPGLLYFTHGGLY